MLNVLTKPSSSPSGTCLSYSYEKEEEVDALIALIGGISLGLIPWALVVLPSCAKKALILIAALFLSLKSRMKVGISREHALPSFVF